LIGTNDSIRDQGYAWPDFQHVLPEIYDKWHDVPHVIVATIPPQLGAVTGDNTWIDANYNPFIKAQAAAHGFTVLDVNYLIQQEPNWQAFYSADGVHLGGLNNGVSGLDWLTQQWSNAVVVATPEPTALLLLGTAGTALAFLYCFRRRRGPKTAE
jgi:hypothetical protein